MPASLGVAAADALTTTVLSESGHRVVVRATLELGGNVTSVDYTLDASDGSELAQQLAQQGSLGALKLARLRPRLVEYATYYARELALDTAPLTRFSEAERAERQRRRPNEPRSQALQAKLALRAALRAGSTGDSGTPNPAPPVRGGRT